MRLIVQPAVEPSNVAGLIFVLPDLLMAESVLKPLPGSCLEFMTCPYLKVRCQVIGSSGLPGLRPRLGLLYIGVSMTFGFAWVIPLSGFPDE